MGISSYLFGHGGGVRPWPSGALDEEGGADLDWGRTRTWGARTQRHCLRPQRHLAMAWRGRHQAMAKQVTGKPIHFPKTPYGVGWGEVRWVGVVFLVWYGLGLKVSNEFSFF